jgi:hypothetical protein
MATRGAFGLSMVRVAAGMNLFRLLRKRTKHSLVLTAIGMAGGYFFDPQMGPARRRRLTNWAKQLPAIGSQVARQGTSSPAGGYTRSSDGVAHVPANS